MHIRKTIVTGYRSEIYDSSRQHTFFGYYDISPMNSDNTKVLAMATDCQNKPIVRPVAADVGYFNIDNPKQFYKIGETTSWCWQQGCRLRWLPENSCDFVFYNKEKYESYGSVIHNMNTGKEEKRLGFPVYDIDQKGKFGLNLNFSRLHRLRPGYGYPNFEDPTLNELCPKFDGVWLCDLHTNRKELIIGLEQIAKIQSDKTMVGAEHYINHLCFNPSGTRFLFFHLWIKNGKRFNRAITSDLSGKKLHVLDNKGFVSHYCWKVDNEILIFSAMNNIPGYYLYCDISDCISSIGQGKLNKDGHPTYYDNSKKLLTDTYPDKILRELALISYDIDQREVNTILKVFSPYPYMGECRCDLHPRMNLDTGQVCIDFPTKSGRKMMILDLSKN